MPVTEQDYEYLTKTFAKLKNYVELKDFRTFLLFNLINESESMIQKLMGGGTSLRTILHDSKGAYLYEYAMTKGRLIFYVKAPLIEDISILDREKHKTFFDEHLSKFEQKKLLTKQDDKIGIVKLTSRAIKADLKYDITPKFEVTRIYEDFLSFLFDIGKSSYVFVIDGEGNKPNIVFALSFLLSNALNQEYIAVQAFLDKEKKYSGQFLRVNSEDFTFESVDEIKEASHSEMFHSDYLLLIHIKSFKSL
ncbi:MAG: hypothetical protein ACTSRE_13550 [Promethearchaeota archaeon]